jgi:hypothetical protein
MFNYGKLHTLVFMAASFTLVTVVKIFSTMGPIVAQVWLQLHENDLVTMITKFNSP